MDAWSDATMWLSNTFDRNDDGLENSLPYSAAIDKIP